MTLLVQDQVREDLAGLAAYLLELANVRSITNSLAVAFPGLFNNRRYTKNSRKTYSPDKPS